MPHTIHIQEKLFASQEVLLPAEQAHHLGRVLRLKIGEKIRLVDINSELFEAVIVKSSTQSMAALVESKLPIPPRPYLIFLCLALLKSEKMELIIEKAVELNVSGVYLFVAKRCVRDELSPNKWQRLQKIADEALKQCGRVVPLILEKFESQKALFEIQSAQKVTHFFCDEQADISLKLQPVANSSVYVWIGPEGGWDESERHFAHDHGMLQASLSSLILRAETAALYAMSVFQNHFL
jgi:16S rRNA (uracil1498-N3)-methyltransferase